MTDQGQRASRNRKRIVGIAAVLALLLAGLLIPPWVSVSRYHIRIAQLISASLGRPVRLSSVELRLLPRPGFVLTDLTVQEDPAYGAEPVLHANSVTADIRLLSLWRGRLEISQISVDEASLNLVRSSSGRWNVDELFRTATQAHGAALGYAKQLPYLEASESRINIKNGLEKLPYSLVNADIELWQDRPGDWRVRLRGQPARTDVSLDLADTGILQLEGNLRQAPQLRQMPIHLEMEWRDAQLGQLSRLVFGSDPGWRGDLRGDLQLDGTAEAAKVQTRLRATGVHRAEFAPVAPLDFDANCSFLFHYSARSLEKLACDSPLGDGRIHLSGAISSADSRELHVQLQRIPVQAALDLLRTVRSGIDTSLQAAGTVSGELAYATGSTAGTNPPMGGKPARGVGSAKRRTKNSKKAMVPGAIPSAPSLAGSLNVEGFKLTGDSLQHPINVDKAVLEADATSPGGAALTTSIALPAGGETPLTMALRFSRAGYAMNLHGPASFARLKEMATAAGTKQFSVLDSLAGDPAVLALQASGPWLPPQSVPAGPAPAAASSGAAAVQLAGAIPPTDQFVGTMTLHGANWKTAALAGPVEISQATLHFNPDGLFLDPLQFVYGPLKGSGTLQIKTGCDELVPCIPVLNLEFQELNAETVQKALLGAPRQGSVLGDLIARWTSARPASWPLLDVSVQAASLSLGPVQLQKLHVALHIEADSANITSLDAELLGGSLRAAGTMTRGEKPQYLIDGKLDTPNAAAVCQFIGLRCTGGPIFAQGKVQTAGFSGADLAASAEGTLHFDWWRGAMSKEGVVLPPPALVRFARWSGDATIAQGAVVLGQNTVTQGAQSGTIEASIPLTTPPRIRFAQDKSEFPAAKANE